MGGAEISIPAIASAGSRAVRRACKMGGDQDNRISEMQGERGNEINEMDDADRGNRISEIDAPAPP